MEKAMMPTDFPESNANFGPPPDLEESQCQRVPAFVDQIKGGSCDGAPIVVVAWMPTPQEIAAIANGSPIFISCIGGLPPHFISTNFEQATRVA